MKEPCGFCLLLFCIWSGQSMRPETTSAEETATSPERSPIELTDAARAIHKKAILIDGHNDLPWTLRANESPNFEKLDIAKLQPDMHTDIPRLREGGVGGQFWSVFVPARTAKQGTSLAITLEQIELVRTMIDKYPDVFEFARTADDIERIHAQGKIASMIGVEGGHSIENSLAVLRQLYDLGAGYMTLTHSDTLDWADSATDEERHGGLTSFGEEVIREMNRLVQMWRLALPSRPYREVVGFHASANIWTSHSAAASAVHPY